MSLRYETRSRWAPPAWSAAVLSGALVLVGIGCAVARAAAPEKAAQSQTPVATRTAVTPSPEPHRVIAYYLHTTYRCPTCRKLEAYAREAIESGFPEEIKTGRLVWQAVDFEKKANKHFVKDFQLYTKSLVLVDEARGEQLRWKNLPKIWELWRDKDAFFTYVQDETRAYLAGKP